MQLQRITLSSRASTSSGGRDHEKQCEGSAALSRASYALATGDVTGTKMSAFSSSARRTMAAT